MRKKGGFGKDSRDIWHKIIDNDTSGLSLAEVESTKNYGEEVGKVLGKEDGSKKRSMDSKIVGAIDKYPEIAKAYSEEYQKAREKVGGKTRKAKHSKRKTRRHRK